MSVTECQYCGNVIVKGDKTFHEEYFGGKNIYCSRKRVIEGYTIPKGKEVEGLDNNKITYFKID